MHEATSIECQRLVAEYLRSSGYSSTLAAFQREAAVDLADVYPASTSLVDIVQSFLRQEQVSKQLASACIGDDRPEDAPFDWHKDISQPLPKRVTRSLRDIHLSGILSVGYCHLPQRTFDTITASYASRRIPCIVTSSSDKRVAFTSTESWQIIDAFEPATAASLTVKLNPAFPYYMLSGAMDGSCTITNLLNRTAIGIKDHTKYVVRVAWSDDGLWFCTLSYDKSICLYECTPTSSEQNELDTDEFAQQLSLKHHLRWRKNLPSNPEAAVFLPGSRHLAFTRRDDHQLHYVSLPEHSAQDNVEYTDKSFNITSYNLNENQDAHVSYSVLSLAIHPSKQAITLQTDTETSRILTLRLHSADKIRESLYTCAEQSSFSNPRHAWLADGSGVAVSSDDGVVRIVDLNGKVKASYGAHGIAAPQEYEAVPIVGEVLRARFEADRGSSVVRDLCVLPDNTVVSVGLDKTIRVAQVA